MLKTNKKLKAKKRLQVLSSNGCSNPMANINIAGILSEIHPVAAGVYNTAYFVIINQKHKPVKTEQSHEMETVEHEGHMTVQKENVVISNEKPKYTYRELITLALADKTCLTLSNIYNWISTYYPFYSASDEKWKNSIRHNLSLYPEFVKGEKTSDGAGHLWYLDNDFRKNYLHHREERMRRKSEQMNEMRHAQVHNKNVEALVEDVMEEELKIKADDCLEAEEEEELEPEVSTPTFYQEQQSYQACIDLITSPELQKSAEEILAGVKRPTAVVGNECLETFSFIATQDWCDREM